MKKKTLIGCAITAGVVITLVIAAFVAITLWVVYCPPYKDNPELRTTLEKVYADYLSAIDREDPLLLISVLTTNRMQMYDEVLRENNLGTFPTDYFRAFKPLMPLLPPTGGLQYIALTQNGNLANLIYVGRMRGFLRKTTDEKFIFIVQFQKENGKWKYLVCTDQPASLVPHLEDRLAKKQLYFLKFAPFKAEEIPLIPDK